MAQIAKALMAGQIAKVVCVYKYTDDYAYDAAANYCEGKTLEVMEMAKELVERPNYWTVWKNNKGEINIGDYNSSYHLQMA